MRKGGAALRSTGVKTKYKVGVKIAGESYKFNPTEDSEGSHLFHPFGRSLREGSYVLTRLVAHCVSPPIYAYGVHP